MATTKATKGGKRTAGSRAAASVAAAKKRGEARQGRVIDAAAEKVKEAAAGRRKPRATAWEVALRDSAIVARARQGWTHKRIAESFDVSERTVRYALEAFRKAPSGLDTAPMQLVEDLLRQLNAMVGDFEQMSAGYAKEHPGVAVQARRQSRETMAEIVALQRMLGVIPSNLGLFRAEADLRHLGEMVLDKLAELERGECEAGDVVRLVREDVMAQALRDLPTRN